VAAASIAAGLRLGNAGDVALRKSDKAGQVHDHLFDIELEGRESPS
jgi:hypothetical protein